MGFSLGKTLKGIGNWTKDLVFGSSGPKNPYGAVDFASLFKQDLETPGNAYDYGGAYKSLMEMIDAPSSVESVLGDVEGTEMQNLVGDVDIETKGSYGSMMSDMAERGLVGPGQSSDIAMNALAQIQGMGARTKSGVRTDYAKARLGRLMGKERRAEDATSNWMAMLQQMAENARTRNLNRILGLTGQQTQAYGQAANLANTKTPGLVEDFMRSFWESGGKTLGGQ